MKTKCLVLLLLLFSKWALATEVKSITADTLNLANLKTTVINRSVMSCGNSANMVVYTSLDIETILAISNAISNKTIPLTTDWNTFVPPELESFDRLGLGIKNLPPDVRRILFVCVAWNEASRLNLFSVPESDVQLAFERVRAERPWRGLASEKRVDRLSDATLKEFVQMVLKVDSFERVRGGIEKNPSLGYSAFAWRVPVASKK